MDPQLLKQSAWELIDAARTEPNDVIRQLMLDCARDLFQAYGETFIERSEIKMGDINILKDSQAGSVGSGASAEGNTFEQTNLQTGSLDLSKLTREFETLSNALFEGAGTVQEKAIVGAVAQAQVAAGNNDEKEMMAALSRADGKALDVANSVGADEAAEALRRAGISTPADRARVVLWAQLDPDEFLVPEEKLGGLAQSRILRNVERYGICLIRPVGHEASPELVASLITMLGTATEWQNEEKGPIKDIRPKPGVDPNTGDSKGDLGFHVDGTQAVAQPPLLLFQYATGATLGANSKFADVNKILSDFPEAQRWRILTSLARHDAATFIKREMLYKGAIFSVSPTGEVMCRIRFDDVIEVHPECKEDFELLRDRFNDPYYPTVFQPLDADVVVFDNWRVMHARDEVYGTRDRHHRRVWFSHLKLEHQNKYKLGVRPVPPEVIAEIEKRSNGGE
jgi:hypothetical protein